MSNAGKRPSGDAQGVPDPAQPATAPPLSDAEFAQLAESVFGGTGSIVLGVSGGPDSMALMHLAARWRTAAGGSAPHMVVATVDHGLRPASAEEAAWVRERASELGLRHETLTWDGRKPVTRIQEKAREARYALLAGLAKRIDPALCVIAVGHHQDDQVETLLMRLARGSGVDGLSAMQPTRDITPYGVPLVRPLLTVPKARLLATLQALGQGWIEDPSNATIAFERVRLRSTRAILEAAGLTGEQVATSARRLTRARAALQIAVRELEVRIVRFNAGAYAAVDTDQFAQTPEELRLRLLQRMLGCFGGASTPAGMSQLEMLVERIAARQQRFAASLGGTLIRTEGNELRVYREPGRSGLPQLRLEPGAIAVWDQRFRIEVDAHCPHAIDIRPITPGLLAVAKGNRTATRSKLPRRAILTLPAAWNGDLFLAPLHPALTHLPISESWRASFAKATFLPPPGDQRNSTD